LTKRFSQLLLGGNHLQLHFARLHVLPRRSDLLLRGRERKPEQLTHPGGILLVNSSGRDSVRPEVRPGPERVRPRAGCASTPLPRTNRTSLVPPIVLSGHAASLTPYSGSRRYGVGLGIQQAHQVSARGAARIAAAQRGSAGGTPFRFRYLFIYLFTAYFIYFFIISGLVCSLQSRLPRVTLRAAASSCAGGAPTSARKRV
jgi:hypothetical protein